MVGGLLCVTSVCAESLLLRREPLAAPHPPPHAAGAQFPGACFRGLGWRCPPTHLCVRSSCVLNPSRHRKASAMTPTLAAAGVSHMR